MRKMFVVIAFILVAEAVGLVGAYFSADAILTWYAALAKPSFAPPNWLFGPVWTTLYALMGIAAFFAWKDRFHKTHADRALNWYAFQLFLNAIWSPVFFGLKNIGFALGIICALWISIIFMMREFLSFNKRAFVLLIPYLAWVSFATVLNYSLWMLN